jgi:hypothetical protein
MCSYCGFITSLKNNPGSFLVGQQIKLLLHGNIMFSLQVQCRYRCVHNHVTMATSLHAL